MAGATKARAVDYDRLPRAERSRRTALLLRRARRQSGAQRAETLREVMALNHRVARAVAARYAERGVPLEDLEQVACVGLAKAVRRFDPAWERDLLSYAVPTIRGEVQRYFRDQSWMLRPPRRIQELQWQISRAADELGPELGREPTTGEICAHLGICLAEHNEAVAAFGCLHPPSLDQPVEHDSTMTLGDTVSGVGGAEEAAEARAELTPALAHLSRTEREMIRLRFVEDLTQREIGERLGLTQVKVSRWLGRILSDLRADLDARSPRHRSAAATSAPLAPG